MGVSISVVVPAKNESRYIGETLKCVFDGSGVDEVIVVDGYSEDDTVSISESFGARVIYDGCNISSARNAGARQAKGDVVVFVDADTIMMDGCIDEIRKIFDSGPEVVGICGKIRPKGNSIDNTLLNRAIVSLFYNRLTKFSFLIRRPHVTGVFMAFRRDALLDAGGFSLDLALGEDTDIYRKISVFGNVSYCPNIMAYTSMRRFRAGVLYWLSYWFMNSLSYEISGSVISRRYPVVR